MTSQPAANEVPFPFDNSYARLPDHFYGRVQPTPVEAPKLIKVNRALAEALGLDADWLASPEGIAVLAGNHVPSGAEPLAMAYSGHQFGHLSPQLGDGRAILLGEVLSKDGQRFDIQLKGSGRTPFSRSGDGRSALGPVIREYIMTEAMHALGVPTTRALAAVTTGEMVMREGPQPGGVFTRVASSHIRVGTFQYFAVRDDVAGVRALADHVIARHYPDCTAEDNPYSALLKAVVQTQAELIAKWLHIGFIHGVMNTDNMSIAGETIDYGPCAFMDAYDPATVYSSIDQQGRYAYGNQPNIGQWNLARLAEALLPLLGARAGDGADTAMEIAQEALDGYISRFEQAYLGGLRAKLGLTSEEPEDLALARDLLRSMTKNKADFTNSFRALCDAAANPEKDEQVRSEFENPGDFDDWADRWRARLEGEDVPPNDRANAMRKVNPAYIPRNHRVEEAIEAGVNDNDFLVFEKLIGVLEKPYDDQPENAAYKLPPRSDQVVHQTFCGT